MAVSVPVGATTSLKLEKMDAKGAVGVPVHNKLLAEVIIVLNALTIWGDRAPWT
jgi:hypothetical protein